EKAMGQEVVGSLTPGQALVGVVHRELVDLMGGQSAGLDFATQPPAVILLVSTDVYRPAAIEQLATLGKNLETEVFPSDPSQKPVDIARAALDYAKKHYH